MQQLRGGMKEAREHREASAKQVPPSHALEDYAGAYADDGYGRFTVTLKDGELVPDYQGIEFVLRHRHFDVWDLRIEMLQQTIPAKFETDFEGNIARLVVPMEPSVAPIVFNRLPDENLSDPDRLSRLVGKYRLGPVTLTVELVEGELVATQDPGAGRVHLVPSRDWSFTAKEAPAMTLEFILDDEGRPTKIMVPGAALTRVAEDAS
jgi:hypothetical protein